MPNSRLGGRDFSVLSSISPLTLDHTSLRRRVDRLTLAGRDESGSPIGDALALGDEARAAFARRAMSHLEAGYTSALMCARTIEVYEELLFPQVAVASGLQFRERLAVPA